MLPVSAIISTAATAVFLPMFVTTQCRVWPVFACTNTNGVTKVSAQADGPTRSAVRKSASPETVLMLPPFQVGPTPKWPGEQKSIAYEQAPGDHLHRICSQRAAEWIEACAGVGTLR